MRPRIGWVVGVSLLAGIGAIGATMRLQKAPPAPRVPGATLADLVHPAGSGAYRTEQEWIVWDVTHTIAQAAAFAKGPSAPGAEDPIAVTTDAPGEIGAPGAAVRFAVTVGTRGEPMTVAVTDHLWAPESYRQLARTLLTGLKRPATREPDPTDTALLTALTDLRIDVILEQNARVSAALARDIASPDAHEDAALLIGALVLREAAGRFDDIRSELSHIAAHLAMARVLRGNEPASVNGTVAEIVLLSAVGRQRDAVHRLDELATTAQSRAQRAWIGALRLRTTGDWRALTQPTKATLLERLEYARALNTRLNSSRFLDFFDSVQVAPLTDWARINLNWHFSVESANRFFPVAVPMELDEAARVWQAFHDGTPSRAALLRDLNVDDTAILEQRGGKPAVLEVVGWHMWARFLQRHLCAQLVNTWRGNYNTGGQNMNGAVVSALDESFGTLRLFPLVLRRVAGTPDEYARSLLAAREILRTHPEWITAANWQRLRDKPEMRVPQPVPFPDDTTWFTPYVPTGTAFDAIDRSLQKGCPRPATPADLGRWAAQAPYDMWIVWAAAWQHVNEASPVEKMRAAFGPLMQYDLGAVVHMRDYLPLSLDQTLELSREACALDTEECIHVAWTLVQSAREQEAAEAFDTWIARARDRVSVSNNLMWLVPYHYDNGRQTRAITLAQMAGNTYSVTGLTTQADLLDRMGRHDDAEALYRRGNDQYQNAMPLAAYYFRQARRTGRTADADKANALVSTLFPNGLESVSLADLHTPPRDGVAFARLTPRADHVGLHTGDIVIAVDGVRVRSLAQYRLVSRLSDNAHMALIVWRDGRYQQLQLLVPQRWFGVVFGDYRPS